MKWHAVSTSWSGYPFQVRQRTIQHTSGFPLLSLTQKESETGNKKPKTRNPKPEKFTQNSVHLALIHKGFLPIKFLEQMTKAESSNTTGMEYNTGLPVMTIAEYGRNVHRMIEYCVTLAD